MRSPAPHEPAPHEPSPHEGSYERRLEAEAERREKRRRAFDTLTSASLEKMKRVDFGDLEGEVVDVIDGKPVGGQMNLRRTDGTLRLRYGAAEGIFSGTIYSFVMPVDGLGMEADYHMEIPIDVMEQAAVLVPQLDERDIEPIRAG